MGGAIDLDPEDFTTLKKFFVGSCETELAKQHESIDELSHTVDSLKSVDHLSEILPEAVERSLKRNSKLAEAFTPLVEDGVALAVAKNKNKMVEAIFPLMGPAIRKAVAEAFRTWVQSMESVIERATSPQSLKWRLESLYTRIPFVEIVLKNTLVYRVEHIFLIHRPSAQILRQLSSPNPVPMDKRTFSGMLEAVKEFTEDVFASDEQLELETLELGRLKVIVSEGRYALLAAVVRGNPPASLNQKITEINADIHRQYKTELAAALPDKNAMRGADVLLEKSLLEQKADILKVPAWRHKFAFGTILATAVGFLFLLTWFIWSRYDRNLRFQKFISDLTKDGTVAITETSHRGKLYTVTALAASPFSSQQAAIEALKSHGFNPGDFTLKFYKGRALEASRYQDHLNSFESTARRLESLTMTAGSAAPLQRLVNEAAPLVVELQRLSSFMDRPFVVYVDYPAEQWDLADMVTWSLYSRLSKESAVDYHVIRTRPAALLKTPEIRFQVQEALE